MTNDRSQTASEELEARPGGTGLGPVQEWDEYRGFLLGGQTILVKCRPTAQQSGAYSDWI